MVFEKDDWYSLKKWGPLILAIKGILFIFYAVHYHIYPEISIARGFLYVHGGDTFTYYPPLISLLSGEGYTGACRMPGLLPFFAPFYLLTKSEEISFNAVIIVQFLISTYSVYILGLISRLLFNSREVFRLTIIFYSLFFHHNGDHFIMADSLANSTLIFAFYFFLLSYKEDFQNVTNTVLSGGFFSISIFLRVVTIVPFVTLLLMLLIYLFFYRKRYLKAIRQCLLFSCIFIIVEGAWIHRNQVEFNKFIPFTVNECYSTFTDSWQSLRMIPAAWGYETTTWIGEVEWFTNEKSGAAEFPYPSKVLTTNYNTDSLTNIKNMYFQVLRIPPGDRRILAEELFEDKVKLYLSEYKEEKFFSYYLINPAKLLWKFHFHERLNDIPFPPVSEMNFFQKSFKAMMWLFFMLSSLTFLFAAPLYLIKNRTFRYMSFLALPFSISFFLSFIFDAIEQRYFWPIVPFVYVFFAVVLEKAINELRRLSGSY